MTAGAWVFGYGSLVSPASLERTIGRTIDARTDLRAAHLAGYGRRWNYGSLHLRGDWEHDGRQVAGGVVVSLGLETADDEVCNGTIARVTDGELAALDWRERDYDRVDVTDRVSLDVEFDAGVVADAPIVTYVPRPGAIERYVAARDAGRAAIRASYWTLVDEAFGRLGGDHLRRYRATPDPDVPVASIRLTTT